MKPDKRYGEIIKLIHDALRNHAHACDDERIYSHEPDDDQNYLDIEVDGYGDWRINLEDCN